MGSGQGRCTGVQPHARHLQPAWQSDHSPAKLAQWVLSTSCPGPHATQRSPPRAHTPQALHWSCSPHSPPASMSCVATSTMSTDLPKGGVAKPPMCGEAPMLPILPEGGHCGNACRCGAEAARGKGASQPATMPHPSHCYCRACRPPALAGGQKQEGTSISASTQLRSRRVQRSCLCAVPIPGSAHHVGARAAERQLRDAHRITDSHRARDVCSRQPAGAHVLYQVGLLKRSCHAAAGHRGLLQGGSGERAG